MTATFTSTIRNDHRLHDQQALEPLQRLPRRARPRSGRAAFRQARLAVSVCSTIFEKRLRRWAAGAFSVPAPRVATAFPGANRFPLHPKTL